MREDCKMLTAEENLKIGDRVHVKNSPGFVRYIGPVDGQKGIWAGIEWDDSSRGRHNGNVNGKQYFATSFPIGGSLVRISTVSRGEDLLHEIRERYNADQEEDSEEMGGRTVERIGMGKISKMQKDLFDLRIIVLDYMKVSRPPPGDTPLFTKCCELNLHGNLLHKWSDVFEILKFFPSLKELVLRNNKMENISSREQLPKDLVKSPIFHLVLNNCRISEETVRHVLSMFPQVTDLYASKNDMSFFNPGEAGSQLKLVDLEHNPIKSMKDVGALARLDKLKSLSLFGCCLTEIRFDSDAGFPALLTLTVKENAISDWESVNEIRRLTSLRTLYIDSHVFKAELGLDVREVLIAKLPSVEVLNRAEISAVERRSAELRFVNKYSTLPEIAIQCHKEDLERLIKIHGAPVIDTAKKGMQVVRMKIDYQGKIITRALPLTTTVSKLRDLVGRLFHVNSDSIRLDLEQEGHVSGMDLPARRLSYYSLVEGDIIRVIIQ